MIDQFNDLTPTEHERLVVLLEELGEAQQAIGKILRHGYESHHPDGGPSNRESLERELGDVLFAIAHLGTVSDIDLSDVRLRSLVKANRVQAYLHHSVVLQATLDLLSAVQWGGTECAAEGKAMIDPKEAARVAALLRASKYVVYAHSVLTREEFLSLDDRELIDKVLEQAARRVTWTLDGLAIHKDVLSAEIQHESDGDFGEIDCGWLVKWCLCDPDVEAQLKSEPYDTEEEAKAAVEKALEEQDDG